MTPDLTKKFSDGVSLRFLAAVEIVTALLALFPGTMLMGVVVVWFCTFFELCMYVVCCVRYHSYLNNLHGYVHIPDEGFW